MAVLNNLKLVIVTLVYPREALSTWSNTVLSAVALKLNMAAFRNYQLKQMKVLSLRMLSPVMERCMFSVNRSLLMAGLCRELVLAMVVNMKEVGNNAVFLELTMLALRL